MLRLSLLFIGGGLGTLLRYLVNGLVSERQTALTGWAALFPWGTMIVNLTGSFVIGFFAAISGMMLGQPGLKPEWRDFLMVGLCGGYTTYSSFALQTLTLARDGEWVPVAVNVFATNVLCLVAVYSGWVAGRFLQSKLQGGPV
jgi:CrcB protein